MRSLTRDVILRALDLLSEQLPAGRPPVDLIVVGGAAGRELKARYAFDDLWESQHGAS